MRPANDPTGVSTREQLRLILAGAAIGLAVCSLIFFYPRGAPIRIEVTAPKSSPPLIKPDTNATPVRTTTTAPPRSGAAATESQATGTTSSAAPAQKPAAAPEGAPTTPAPAQLVVAPAAQAPAAPAPTARPALTAAP